MAQYTRQKLARGTKLTSQHIRTPLQAIASDLAIAGLDQLEQSWGVMYVNLHVPVLDSTYFAHATDDGQKVDFCIPFCLPPLQEHWDVSGQTLPSTPLLVLDECTVSFEQRGEPAAVVNLEAGSASQGYLSYDIVGQLNLQVALMEKSQWYFNNAQANEPDREVFSLSLNSTAYAGRFYRFNPFTKTGLSKTLNPYKTYVLMINAQDLHGGALANQNCALPSLTLSLKIRHPMVERDKGDSIQNIPLHNGIPTGQTITPLNPAADSLIQATGADGVQTSLEAFDLPLLKGLESGYERDGSLAPVEAIVLDSAYEILCVPMWGNFGTESAVRAANVTQLPYQTSNLCADWTIDRRIIPIQQPWTIHHVTAVAGYAYPYDGTSTGRRPTSATFNSQVGVGLGTGLRGDLFKYQQVAWKDWTPGSILTRTIDHVKSRVGGTLTLNSWDFDLLNIPLVGAGGSGYYPQGTPVFCGSGTSRTADRSNIDGGASAVKGLEQWLEVRWAFKDVNGLGHTPGHDAGPWGAAPDAFAGAAALTGTGGTTLVTDTAGYTKQAGEPNHGGNAGGQSAWYKWVAPRSGICVVDTTGTTGAGGVGLPSPLLGVYTGAAVNALTTIGGNNGGFGGVATVTFTANAGTTYYFALDGIGGLANWFILNWQLSSGVAQSDYTTYVGRGGNWVLIHGKKSVGKT